MDLMIYNGQTNPNSSLNNFMDMLHGCEMNHLASELLREGWPPEEIQKAFQRAMSIAKMAGLQISHHFCPVYTQNNDGTIRDCKLSKLGFLLVIINGSTDLPLVAVWQINLISNNKDEF